MREIRTSGSWPAPHCCRTISISLSGRRLDNDGHLLLDPGPGSGLARLEIELSGWVGRTRTHKCRFEEYG